MKVHELIENLQKCNPESEIIMELDDMDSSPLKWLIRFTDLVILSDCFPISGRYVQVDEHLVDVEVE